MKEDVYVIIHGYGGGLHEIEYAAQYLRNKGLDVRMVLLAGHGGTKEELAKHSHTDWIRSVGNTIDTLKREYRRIHLIGFSMGGLICTHFASIPEVDRIVFVNTPIYMWNFRVIGRDVLYGILRRRYEKLRFYRGAIAATAFKSNLDFLRILYASKELFAARDKPTLIIQCKDDESAHYKSALYIKKRMGANAALRYYSGGCHMVFGELCETRDAACADMYKWFRGD